MAGEQTHNSPLEPFILLAKNTKGAALIALINQLLEAPGVYVYGEFLDLPHVQEVSKGPNREYSQLLNIFAYGTYLDYKENEVNLPPLTDLQKNKLRQLTFVSLAGSMQCIPYSMLLQDLELRSLRQLEDLFIDAVYADVIRGKLDQRRQLLELEACIGRDVRPREMAHIARTLQEWYAGWIRKRTDKGNLEANHGCTLLSSPNDVFKCSSCWTVMSAVELQVDRVSQFRARRLRSSAADEG
ncbi:COP9 signalosome complex subunit 7b-like isoform X2 [Brienomyrus brachyistius]|nr:COP9 signalosome complex subunit 7b-like isoform X2 [Brienomyrus brachyistius]XP_048861038.1 COP9 signalosome complex subunit 7b-like isoform X2 [Brienomyrus brachyistius]